jgi:HD-GYP domain-containing protein (c-di-GMP phosphodiesterase class II)
MSLFEARDVIAKGSGTDFDPRVVNAFLDAFRRGEMEGPALLI